MNEDLVIISQWLNLVNKVIWDFGIDERDIYKFDESRLTTGLAVNVLVVTQVGFDRKKYFL